MPRRSNRKHDEGLVEPLFHPFDLDVPDADRCLDQVYAVFDDVPVSYGWCRQCFDLDIEQQMRTLRNVREAPLAAFSPIYFEHPNCSGGAATFFHWLPRGLELGFFDRQFDPVLTEQLMRLGLWRRPAEEQAALRALFLRVARNWFEAGHVEPLQIADSLSGASHRLRLNISRQIVDALLCLRVDPAGLFAWLAGLAKADALDCLLDLLQDDKLLPDPSYYALDDNEAKAQIKAGLEALDRIARHQLHALLPGERLIAMWMAWQHTDPAMAERIADAESMTDTYAIHLAADELLADEACIRAAITCDASSPAQK